MAEAQVQTFAVLQSTRVQLRFSRRLCLLAGQLCKLTYASKTRWKGNATGLHLRIYGYKYVALRRHWPHPRYSNSYAG